jgi:hypothetical protein
LAGVSTDNSISARIGRGIAFVFWRMVVIFAGIWLAYHVTEYLRNVPHDDKSRAFCRASSICQHFAKVRQDCATAGDFTNCIEVKMGRDYSSVDQCDDEGGVAGAEALKTTPSAFQCFVDKLLQ